MLLGQRVHSSLVRRARFYEPDLLSIRALAAVVRAGLEVVDDYDLVNSVWSIHTGLKWAT